MSVVVWKCIHDHERRLSAIENKVLSVVGLCRQFDKNALAAAFTRGFDIGVSPRRPHSIHFLTMAQFVMNPANSYLDLPLIGRQWPCD